jgi:hypothetical protein
MGKLKLTVNEDKTRICKVPEGEFDFLGYTFTSPSIVPVRFATRATSSKAATFTLSFPPSDLAGIGWMTALHDGALVSVLANSTQPSPIPQCDNGQFPQVIGVRNGNNPNQQ